MKIFLGRPIFRGYVSFRDDMFWGWIFKKTDIVFVGWFLFFVLSDRKGWRINWLRGGVCFARANKLFYPVILLLEEIRLTRWGWQLIPLFPQLYTSQVQDFFQQQYVCLSLSYWQTNLNVYPNWQAIAIGFFSKASTAHSLALMIVH